MPARFVCGFPCSQHTETVERRREGPTVVTPVVPNVPRVYDGLHSCACECRHNFVARHTVRIAYNPKPKKGRHVPYKMRAVVGNIKSSRVV